MADIVCKDIKFLAVYVSMPLFFFFFYAFIILFA